MRDNSATPLLYAYLGLITGRLKQIRGIGIRPVHIAGLHAAEVFLRFHTQLIFDSFNKGHQVDRRAMADIVDSIRSGTAGWGAFFYCPGVIPLWDNLVQYVLHHQQYHRYG